MAEIIHNHFDSQKSSSAHGSMLPVVAGVAATVASVKFLDSKFKISTDIATLAKVKKLKALYVSPVAPSPTP